MMNILKNNNFFEKKFSLHLGWTLFVLGLMVLISILFKVFRIEEFNILLVFLTGVFFIVIKAKNFLYGIFSSVLCVMYFNTKRNPQALPVVRQCVLHGQ